MNHLTPQQILNFYLNIIYIYMSTFFIKYNEQTKKICFQYYNQNFFLWRFEYFSMSLYGVRFLKEINLV